MLTLTAVYAYGWHRQGTNLVAQKVFAHPLASICPRMFEAVDQKRNQQTSSHSSLAEEMTDLTCVQCRSSPK